MEKITSEQLLKELEEKKLSNEELADVAGGTMSECMNACYAKAAETKDGEALQECLMACLNAK